MTGTQVLVGLAVGLLLFKPRRGRAEARPVDRSPPLGPSPTASIVDAPDGAHYHLVADGSGALLGVFDTVDKAAEVGRGLGYVVSR